MNDSDILTESNNTWNTNSSDSVNYTPSTYNETEFEFSENINASTEELDYLSGCCSVLLHVRDGYDVFAYRRDSTYAANLYITVTNWYGKTAVKEYKTTNSYFFHTIVTLDGWMVGIGGADIPGVVQQLESLAGNTAASGKITSSTISSALSLVSRLAGIGHFIIKAPNNVVGYAIVNGGRRSGLFTMGNGQYLAVPNSPSCYRSGYVSTSSPVSTTMSLAYNNPWGVNHRNVIAYEYVRTSDVFNYITKINVYASKSLRSDNIVFRGNFISGSSLPTTPSKRYIGQIVKKVSRPTTQFGYENMIYTYSEILDTYSTTGSLPGSVGVGPWMVTVGDVIEAAEYVQNYIEINHKLPSSVTVNGMGLNMPTFLKLLTTSIIQIENNDLNSLIKPISYGNPPTPGDSMSTGYLHISDYLTIAQNVNNFMNSKGRAPNCAPNSSFGPYVTALGAKFGYHNMIYTYSKILVIYNNTGTLPENVQVKAWKVISDPNAAIFTLEQVLNAASDVKNYIEICHQLPSAVIINEKKVTMPTFLELLTTAVLQIYNNDFTTLIDSVSYGSASSPRDSISTGNIQQEEYILIAERVKRYIDYNYKAPAYSSSSSLGTYFGYENIIYTYSNILDIYKSVGTLPTTMELRAWKEIVVDFNTATFTIDQTLSAATWVKNYIETNQNLPDYVNINGINTNMADFLKLLTTAILKIHNNDNSPTEINKIYKNPTAPLDNVKSGTITQSTYLDIAGRVQRYMDHNLKAPNYSSYSGLGSYFGYQNMIYTFSKILDAYNPTLPANIQIVPWNYITNYAGTFTIQQVTDAATWVKNYIETEQKLPDKIPITGTNLQGTITNTEITLPAYLELITTITQKIQNQDNTPTPLANIYANPTTPKDNQKMGNMPLNTYLDIAGRIQRYMDHNLKAPNYSSYSNLGTYFGYQNMIYTFSKILDAYNPTLPANIQIVPWNYITNYAGTFTIQQVTDAATWVKNYIETEQKLPDKIPITGTNLQGTITNTEITLPAYLELITTITQKIQNQDNTPTPLANIYANPTTLKDNQKMGNMPLNTYLDIAGRIQRYMDHNLKAPNYSSYSNLGTYFGYQNMIYTFSKILDTYNTTGTLPDSVTVNPWIAPVTVKQVINAAKVVKKFIDINHKLPSSVTVGENIIYMPTFLELLINSVLQIEKKDLTTLLKPQVYYGPSQSQDKMKTRNMLKSEYIAIARNVDSYMNSNGKAPGYATALKG